MGPLEEASRVVALLALVVAAGIAVSCDAGGPAGPDADADLDDEAEADRDREADVVADADAVRDDGDDDAAAMPGPLTLVVYERGVSTERLCDVDGNGTLDNAIADLGTPAAELAASVASAAFQKTIHAFDVRTVVHFPWVDDLSIPDDPVTAIAAFEGVDMDLPPDPDDDFSGREPFLAHPKDLDGCGEPRMATRDASILDGEADAPIGRVTVDYLTLRGNVRAMGSIAPGGSSAELGLCGYLAAADLGAIPLQEATWLEAMVSGGLVVGVPGVPGVTPDIDVDRDGLERFVTDDQGRLATCIDGDGHTTIEGRDCWQDPGMTDGFSVTIVLDAVSARFAGPGHGLIGTCDDRPEESFWDFR